MNTQKNKCLFCGFTDKCTEGFCQQCWIMRINPFLRRYSSVVPRPDLMQIATEAIRKMGEKSQELSQSFPFKSWEEIKEMARKIFDATILPPLLGRATPIVMPQIVPPLKRTLRIPTKQENGAWSINPDELLELKEKISSKERMYLSGLRKRGVRFTGEESPYIIAYRRDFVKRNLSDDITERQLSFQFSKLHLLNVLAHIRISRAMTPSPL